MPIRNYKCKEGHEWTALEGVNEDIKRICKEPDCGAEAGIDYSKLTGIGVQWRGGPPTPKFGR